ncbi:hypothetical protein LSPH26S_03822 [Lysinibacillus sphaericus]
MPITLAIIAITCVVSFMAFKNARLMNDLILWPPAITRQREYHRLVTYGVVHADFGHLLFNMFTLFFFGRAMEPFYTGMLGTLGFALFYIGGLVVSILPTYLKNRSNPDYRSLGASARVGRAVCLHPDRAVAADHRAGDPDAGDRLRGAVHGLFDLHGSTRAGQRQPQRAPVWARLTACCSPSRSTLGAAALPQCADEPALGRHSGFSKHRWRHADERFVRCVMPSCIDTRILASLLTAHRRRTNAWQ